MISYKKKAHSTSCLVTNVNLYKTLTEVFKGSSYWLCKVVLSPSSQCPERAAVTRNTKHRLGGFFFTIFGADLCVGDGREVSNCSITRIREILNHFFFGRKQ